MSYATPALQKPTKLGQRRDSSPFGLRKQSSQSPFGMGQRRNSQVDESLFGSSYKRGSQGSPPPGMSLGQLRDLREQTMTGKKNDGVVITMEELERIKGALQVTPVPAKREARESFAAQREKEMMESAAKIRKEKMTKIDLEKKNRPKKQELTIEQKQRAEGLLPRAKAMLDEQEDDVKGMNSKLLFSKVATIRDRQIEENKALERQYMQEQKNLDMMMEIERLKQIKEDQEREERRAAARKKGQMVLVDQISERYQDRVKQQEIQVRELDVMHRQMQSAKAAEEKLIRDKQEKAKQMLVEVATANDLAKQYKDKKKLEDQQLDEEIHSYNKNKERQEFERHVMDKKIKEQKERETAKIREKQEECNDQQEAIESLRMQKAFEKGEREARMREKLLEDKRLNLIKELDNGRRAQFAGKEQKLADESRDERDNYLNIIQCQKDAEDKERNIEEQKLNAFKRHQGQLMNQMDENCDKKKIDKLDYLEEGRKLRQKLADEILKLETIKSNKVNSMETLNISKKYQTDLLKQKIEI